MKNLEGRGSATGDKGLIAKSQRVLVYTLD